MASPDLQFFEISYVPVPTDSVFHASEAEHYIPKLNLYDIDDGHCTTDLKGVFFTDNYKTARLYTTKIGGLFKTDEDWDTIYENYDPIKNWPPRRGGSIIEAKLDWKGLKEIPLFHYTDNGTGIQAIHGIASNIAHKNGYPGFYVLNYGSIKQEPELVILDDSKVRINIIDQKRWAPGDSGFETPVLASTVKMKRHIRKPQISSLSTNKRKSTKPPFKIPKLPGKR